MVRCSLDLRYQHAAVPIYNIGELHPAATTWCAGAWTCAHGWDRLDAEIACYPQVDEELRGAEIARPESVVRSAAEFNQIRQRYKRSSPPSPDRGWIPYDQRPGAS